MQVCCMSSTFFSFKKPWILVCIFAQLLFLYVDFLSNKLYITCKNVWFIVILAICYNDLHFSYVFSICMYSCSLQQNANIELFYLFFFVVKTQHIYTVVHIPQPVLWPSAACCCMTLLCVCVPIPSVHSLFFPISFLHCWSLSCGNVFQCHLLN